MRRVVLIAAVAAMTLFGGKASAGTLQTIDGTLYSGVVEQVSEIGVKFLWEKEKDQPEEIKIKKADLLFRAQGNKAELRDIPYTSIAKIEGVPVDRFPPLFNYNLFFRTIQEVEAGRIRVSASGDFYRQVKSASVLLIVLLVLVPLLLSLVSTVLPGERLSFFGGVGFAVMFTLIGMGAALGCGLVTTAIPAMASAGAQIGLTAGIVLILALVTHMGTSHSFWQGIAFTVVWGASLLLAGRLAARLAGVGDMGV